MISILIALVILGVVLYLIGLVPIDATVAKVIRVLAILFVVLYCLQLLGVWHGGPNLR